MTTLTKRVSAPATGNNSKRVDVAAIADVTLRVTGAIAGSAVKRVISSNTILGPYFDYWGRTWGPTWGRTWSKRSSFDEIGLTRRVAAQAAASHTKRVTM